MFIFLDESGNFAKDNHSYFIVGGFLTGKQKRTAKAFRSWQHIKFSNKKLRYRAEVKFSDTRLTDDLRAKTLLHFTEQDIRIFYTFLNKENIPLEFRQSKGLESGRLYAEIVAKTIQLLLPAADLEFRIFSDKRSLKRISQSEFRELIRLDLLPKLPAKVALQIETVNSSTNPNIQIADWICGALYRYYNKGRSGEKFYDIIRNSIIASDELFKDYWKTKNPDNNRNLL